MATVYKMTCFVIIGLVIAEAAMSSQTVRPTFEQGDELALAGLYNEVASSATGLLGSFTSEDEEVTVRVTRMDRFYYCGPKNRENHCRSLCYALGYPYISCGRVSCYCTF